MAARAAIFGCEGHRLSARERAFLADADPWGFILFARNVDTPAQVAALVDALRETVGRRAPVLIDQEGGRVARLRAPHWREWDDVATAVDGLSPGAAEALLRLRYRVIAAELTALGIDVDCAPLLDVPQPGAHAIIGARALGAEPALVARLGRAVREGLEAGGVAAVIKHIPGHGRAGVDSHAALPVVDAPRETLAAADFAAFRPHADAAMAMTAHVLYAALDPDACATFSPAVIGAIRHEIGFDGLLMTDDISMGALEGPLGARVSRALAAGCDMILHCNGDPGEMAAVAEAAPLLEGRARARADAATLRRTPEPFDIAEADLLLNQRGVHA